ncbi:MAG TPA: phage/plasmid primase, P4 family, partial [Candidatus Saccharimonadia bacterium]|nr:phage/plasmid primase, P4 family [Candidatus Saccharimonadia bacterium]
MTPNDASHPGPEPAPVPTPPPAVSAFSYDMAEVRKHPAYRRAQQQAREVLGIAEPGPLPEEKEQEQKQKQAQDEDTGTVIAADPADGLYNDDRNARDFISTCEEDVRHCVSTGTWFQWSGLRWMRDPKGGGMMERARHFSRELMREAHAHPIVAERKFMVQRAQALGNMQRLKPLLKLSRSDTRVAVPDTAVWDADPFLLGVENGVIDMRACRYLPPQRDMMITKAAGVTFDAAAACPKWEAFIAQILPDPEVRLFMQVSAGYWLTGDTSAQCFWFLYGSGANGKSTFLETLYRLGSGYSQRANEMLASNPKGNNTPLELSTLPGVRLLVGSEVADGMKLNEVLVKDITGGDTVSGRGHYKAFFPFRPSCKLVMYGNHRPTISGTDGGMWRRVRLVPFTTVIPFEQRNPHLQRELMAELPGILNWCLHGLAHWHAHGLPTPKAVLTATEAYREDSDPLGEFLQEVTERVPDMDQKVLLNELYKKYGEWCEESGRRGVLSRQSLRVRMEDRGYASKMVRM